MDKVIVNYNSLFEEVCNCRWKSELVDTFARYGIKDSTISTGPTTRTNSSGKSTDLYAAFRVPEAIKNSTHMYFEVNKIRIDTNEAIASDVYFSGYKIYDHPSDNRYRNKCFSIAYDVDEFKYVLNYFLRYECNWLDREYTEIDPVPVFNLNTNTINEQNEILKKRISNIVNIIDNEIKQIPLQGEEKQALTKIRVNQSVFRKLLIEKYGHCCLCNVDSENLLVASHIKPWTKCDGTEKLDVDNGLLLCPNHDKLFDKGYISFDDNGKIIISNSLSDNNQTFMNIRNNMRIDVNDKRREYLKYHREEIFIDD